MPRGFSMVSGPWKRPGRPTGVADARGGAKGRPHGLPDEHCHPPAGRKPWATAPGVGCNGGSRDPPLSNPIANGDEPGQLGRIPTGSQGCSVALSPRPRKALRAVAASASGDPVPGGNRAS